MAAYHRQHTSVSVEHSVARAQCDKSSVSVEEQSPPPPSSCHHRYSHQYKDIHTKQQFNTTHTVYEAVENLSEAYGYLPPEPTPPDSGRSKPHAHHYDLNVFAEEQNSSADEDGGVAYASDSDESGLCDPRLDNWHTRAASSVVPRPCEERPRPLGPQAPLGPSRDEHQAIAGPSSSRQACASLSPPLRSPSSSPVSPLRTFAKPSHAGVVFDQRPIRDTPNNPFLEEYQRRYTRADARYDDKRHSRGEEAVKAHRRGFLTYVL